MLARFPNLHLDTSATKWMVRELSRHEPTARQVFFRKWQGRLLFGSDIVTRNNHLHEEGNDAEEKKSASPAEAYELYASRYWALRTLFETSYTGPSPIADPDLHLVDPDTFGPEAAPMLRGAAFSLPLLKSFYHDAPAKLLEGIEP
jgi:hypothetical protein